MQNKTSSSKFARLAVLISCLCSGCAIAEENKQVTPPESENIEVDLATQQMELEKQAEAARLEAERKAEEERLAIERQKQAEAKLTETIGEVPLQFRSDVAKIYNDGAYALLWQDKEARKQFLREYAAMVASGISPRSAKSLEAISNADEANNPLYDILLTDAFLDYMYYAANVSQSAQNWLYSARRYKAAKPADLQIEQWLNAVKNGQSLSFINQISSPNALYKQTIDGFVSLLLAPTAEQDNNDVSNNKKKKNKKRKDPLADLYKLAINAQRLRVIPEFHNGIFVNIPSYQLNYYRDGQLVLDSRVIVGTQRRKTPVMYSKLSDVVVNPPWNAPPRLINEDIIPRVKNDPSYLSRNGYSIIDSRGKSVDPYSIDWTTMGKFPYRLRQAAGDNSALGRYKFNMPSSDAIYLHDTPKRSLFNKKNRALSSGCVRVEKSDELATMLLAEAGWSADKKQRVLKSRRTTSANILSDNPVYLYYVTTWIDNGTTHTLPDIYGYDKTPNLNYVNWDVVRKYLQ